MSLCDTNKLNPLSGEMSLRPSRRTGEDANGIMSDLSCEEKDGKEEERTSRIHPFCISNGIHKKRFLETPRIKTNS